MYSRTLRIISDSTPSAVRFSSWHRALPGHQRPHFYCHIGPDECVVTPRSTNFPNQKDLSVVSFFYL